MIDFSTLKELILELAYLSVSIFLAISNRPSLKFFQLKKKKKKKKQITFPGI